LRGGARKLGRGIKNCQPNNAAASDRFSGFLMIAVLYGCIAQNYRLEGSLPCFSNEWKLYRRVP